MISFAEFSALMADRSPRALEQLAQRAAALTRQHFGRAIGLYAPLYLADICDNSCLYCGFRLQRGIRRHRLEPAEWEAEMERIAAGGIRSILLLTGDSRRCSPPEYIRDAVQSARRRFGAVAIEVYALYVEEYRMLSESGLDGVTIYQETFDRERYRILHPAGPKADYDFRVQAPYRIAASGVRFLNLGILLGLASPVEDLYALFSQVDTLQKEYPGVDFQLSFPRLRLPADAPGEYFAVDDVTLVQAMCLARLLFPRVGITLSTRENASLRDHLLEIAVTRISAGSRTSVGGYGSGEHGEDQFTVQDDRSVAEIVAMLKSRGFDPVFTDWRSPYGDGA